MFKRLSLFTFGEKHFIYVSFCRKYDRVVHIISLTKRIIVEMKKIPFQIIIHHSEIKRSRLDCPFCWNSIHQPQFMHYIYITMIYLNLRIRNTLVKYFALLGNNPHLCNIFRFVNKKNMTKNVLMSQRYICGALVFTAKSRDLLSKETLKLHLHIFLRF